MNRFRAAGAVAGVVLAILVAACDTADTPRQPQPVANPQVACLGGPRGGLQGAFHISGEAPGSVAQIVVQCTAPVCTNSNGEQDVTIVFIDGRRESSGYAWAGAEAPPLQIAPVCLGVMISTGDLKKGVAIELDGELWQILDYHHIKMGRGSAQVRITLRNIKRGRQHGRALVPGGDEVAAGVDGEAAGPVPLPTKATTTTSWTTTPTTSSS